MVEVKSKRHKSKGKEKPVKEPEIEENQGMCPLTEVLFNVSSRIPWLVGQCVICISK